MGTRTVGAVIGVLLLVAVVVIGTMPGLGALDSPVGPAQVDDEEASSPPGLGQQISSFMQSSVAELNGTVETEMWNRSAADPPAVERRAATLEQRLQRLEERRDRLAERRDRGDLSETEYRANMSRLVGEYVATERGLAVAAGVADRVGADPGALDRARERSAAMRPSFAEAARGMPGGTPPGLEGNGNGNGPPGRNGEERPGGGPPDDRGQSGEDPGDRGGGPPDDRGDGSGGSGGSGGPPG